MIKHIVAWKLKDIAEGKSKQENALKAKKLLESLNGKIPGMLHLEVGIDFSKTDSSSDIVLYSEFEDKKSLDEYQKHAEHEKIKPFIKLIIIERRLIDYEIVVLEKKI